MLMGTVVVDDCSVVDDVVVESVMVVVSNVIVEKAEVVVAAVAVDELVAVLLAVAFVFGRFIMDRTSAGRSTASSTILDG